MSSVAAPAPGPSRSSRLLAYLLTPFVAVVPWLLTLLGIGLVNRGMLDYQRTFETPWTWVLGGAGALVLAALLWALLTAWSSLGTLLAGLLTLILGLLVPTRPVSRWLVDIAYDAGSLVRETVLTLTNPVYFLLIGSLLVAAALAASGARRLARTRTRRAEAGRMSA